MNKKINLIELKQNIRNIVKETIYHTNVVPIQTLVKAIKKEQNNIIDEDKTKKQNQDLNLIKKSKIEEELKNIKETVDIIPSYQEKEKYLLRKINEYKRKINWIIRDENFYELQYPNKFKLIYVSKSKLNFIDYLDKINQPQIKDYLSIIFHILNFINNIPTKPPSGILAGNKYSAIDLHHTITAAIHLEINKIPLILLIGK